MVMLSDNRLRLLDAAVNKIKNTIGILFQAKFIVSRLFYKGFSFIKTIIQSGETFSVISQD